MFSRKSRNSLNVSKVLKNIIYIAYEKQVKESYKQIYLVY